MGILGPDTFTTRGLSLAIGQLFLSVMVKVYTPEAKFSMLKKFPAIATGGSPFLMYL